VLQNFCNKLPLLVFLAMACPVHASTYKDIIYGTVNGKPLHLDLYTPATTTATTPIIVWIHGGGWYSGSKSDCPILPEVTHGYAVASVEYRLSTTAPFPAQIEDCRAALTWLRANGQTYGFNPARMAVAGFSAGGHLAALLGVTDPELLAVIDGFGPTQLIDMAASVSANAPQNPQRAITQLLGGSPFQVEELAKQASPLCYVNSLAKRSPKPVFLILHAVHDSVVPIEQSASFNAALKQAGVTTVYFTAPTGGHGPNPLYPAQIQSFLLQYLHS
jgi:acetyl esterase/lipase